MKRKFSRGMKVRVIKTTLDDIAIKHATHHAMKTGSKRMPSVEIHHEEDPHHDTDHDKYHMSVRERDHQGSPTGRGYDKTFSHREFLRHTLNLHRDHEKMQPFPHEAALHTRPNGWVDLHVANPKPKKSKK